MNWNLLFFLFVVVGIPLTFVWWGLWQLIQNWSGPKGYRAQVQKFWAGEEKKRKKEKKKILKESSLLGPSGEKYFTEEEVEEAGEEEPEKNKGLKDILKEKAHIVLLMYVSTLMVCFIIPIIGGFWISVAFGFAVGTLLTIKESVTWKGGLVIWGAVGLLSIVSESIITAPLYTAAVMFLLLGPPTYLLEEATKKDIFPWRMIDVCLIMMAVNLFLGLIYLFGFEHSAFIPEEAVDGSIAYDLYAEATRITYTGSAWLDIVKWFIAILLILITSGPIDLAQRLKARKAAQDEKAKKGQPAESGHLTLTKYVIYELLISFLFRMIGRDELGRKLEKPKKSSPDAKKEKEAKSEKTKETKK